MIIMKDQEIRTKYKIFILNPKTKNNSKHKVMHSYLVKKLKLTSTRMNAYLQKWRGPQ